MKLPEELIFMKNSRLKQKVSNEPMDNKLCVITGATSGVGLSALKKLAEGNADLVIVARNKDKALKVKSQIKNDYNKDIDIFIADFSKLDTVRDAASKIKEKYKKIDILINSVGIHNTRKRFNEDGYEMVFCVNHLSTFLFTYLLLENLKQDYETRIIQVNSEGHRFNGLNLKDIHWKKRIYLGIKGYGAAKTAQLMTVWELNDLLQDTNITINAMHPGAVRTGIGSNNGWFYRFLMNNFIKYTLKDVSISGEALYYLASSSEMNKVSGKFFNLTIEEKPAKHALNREVGKKIFELSKELTNLK